jgi:hypothetical protein
MMLYHTIVGVHAGVEWIANREGSRPGWGDGDDSVRAVGWMIAPRARSEQR